VTISEPLFYPVILSVAKNLIKVISKAYKILRYAQHDKKQK